MKYDTRSVTLVPNQPRLVDYDVHIYTCNDKNADTDGEVSIRPNSPDCTTEVAVTTVLSNALNHMAIFERGSCDVFRIRAPRFADIETVSVAHKPCKLSSCWKLDKIVVSAAHLDSDLVFEHAGWLSSDTDPPTALVHVPRGYVDHHKYHVTIVTGSARNASTDAAVYIQLLSDTHKSVPLKLEQSLTHSIQFCPSQTDVFSLHAPSVGRITSIVVWHDGVDVRDSWQLENVCITSDAGDHGDTLNTDHSEDRSHIEFWHQDWIKADDKVELVPTLGAPKLTCYVVAVKTSSFRYAGMDAAVFVKFHGEHDMVHELSLIDSSTHVIPFQTDQHDLFAVHVPASIGHILRLTVRIESVDQSCAWHLDRIELRSEDGSSAFLCQAWIRPNHPLELQLCNREIRTYELKVKTSDEKGAGHN